jgi:hypothetical protein
MSPEGAFYIVIGFLLCLIACAVSDWYLDKTDKREKR